MRSPRVVALGYHTMGCLGFEASHGALTRRRLTHATQDDRACGQAFGPQDAARETRGMFVEQRECLGELLIAQRLLGRGEQLELTRERWWLG